MSRVVTPWGILNLGRNYFRKKERKKSMTTTRKENMIKNTNSDIFEVLSVLDTEDEVRSTIVKSLEELQRKKAPINNYVVFLDTPNEKYRGYWRYNSEEINQFGKIGVWEMFKRA